MKSKFYKLFLVLLSSMCLTLVSGSASAHYWHHGWYHHGWYYTHHYCCGYTYRNCGWVPGHWRHHHWIRGHRVCWR